MLKLPEPISQRIMIHAEPTFLLAMATYYSDLLNSCIRKNCHSPAHSQMRTDPQHRFVVLSLPDGRVLCLASIRDVRVLRMSHLTDHPMAFICTL